ncbi:hypothetical protein GE118_00770 [Mycoplasma sp. NEAQ87857]|nr:hypothetical protein GE118_00770 [Mycoplasma sp. NEAQ87857]
MRNYKRKVIIWFIIAILAFIAMIGLSVLIWTINTSLEQWKTIRLDRSITDSYYFIKSYSIGGLALSCLLFLMGSVISYSGFKSWRYSEMFI